MISSYGWSFFPSVGFIRRPLRVNPTSSGPGDDNLVAEEFDVKVQGRLITSKRAPAEADAPVLKGRIGPSSNYIFFSEHMLVLASHIPPAF
jgi:hypothetical protein